MEMKRDIREEEENMCTSLLTASLVLSVTCLKRFSSVSYLIEQWRPLVFLLLNIILLAVYFTSTHPISHESHDFKTLRGSRLRMMRVKKKKKKKKKISQDFLVIEPQEVIKNCIVEETKRVTVKDCVSMDLSGEEDEFEPGRLSNEELNERVEAFITTFRQHLVIDARRGRDTETDQKIRCLGREVTCSV